MSDSKKSAGEERRSAMRKRAERALREQQQEAQKRLDKTARLKALRLAREEADEHNAGKPDAALNQEKPGRA